MCDEFCQVPRFREDNYGRICKIRAANFSARSNKYAVTMVLGSKKSCLLCATDSHSRASPISLHQLYFEADNRLDTENLR